MSTEAVGPVERTRRRGPVHSTAAVVVAVSLATAAWFAFGTDSDGPQPSGRSQLVAGGVTVSPAPGARDASPESEISFLGASSARLGAVSVVGSDSGPGISPEERERIFRPFWSRDGGGTGLGLAIAREVIEAHGGTITIRNVEAGGAVVTIDLPRVAAVAERKQA